MTEMEPNAFTINRLGLDRMFFPLSLKVTLTGGVTSVYMFAQRVTDCADQIAACSTGHLVLFGLDQFVELDELTGHPLPLAELVRRADIPFTAIDEDTIVIPARHLTPLLKDFYHVDLKLFDLPPVWDEFTVIQGVLAYREHNWKGDDPLLPELPGSRIFIDSHDDCYLAVESVDTLLPRQIFARMLGLYAAAVLERTDIGAVPPGLVDTLWQEEFGLSILRGLTEITPTGLTIGVSKKPFNFTNGEMYRVDFYLEYDAVNRVWG